MKTLLVLLLLLLAAPAAAATVSLRERAETSGPYVRLGEVAELTGADPLWADIFLGPAPAAGEARSIRRDAVKDRLAYLGLAARMEGAEEVEVRLGRGPEAPLADEIIRRLRASGLVPSGELKLPETPLEVVEVRDGAWGEALVRLKEKESGHERLLTVKIQRLRKAVVVLQPLRMGRVLDTGDLGVQELPERSLPAVTFRDPSECLGRRMIKPVKAGSVLEPSDLQLPRAVARGSLCTLTAKSGGLKVTCQASALRDGKLGELIPFEIKDSGKRLMARVLGDDEACMDPHEDDEEGGR